MSVGEEKTQGPLSEWARVTSSEAGLLAHELWKKVHSHAKGCIFPTVLLFLMSSFTCIYFLVKAENPTPKERRKLEVGMWENLTTKKQHKRILGVRAVLYLAVMVT